MEVPLRFAVPLLLLLAAEALADDCPDRDNLGTTPAMVEERLAEAEALYPTIYEELEALEEIEVWVRDGMSCLTEPASPELAARFHRFQALATDPLGGLAPAVRDEALASLAASHRLEPEHSFALPEDHGHHADPGIEARALAVPSPSQGELYFDGSAANLRPQASATFFQRVDRAGAVVDAAYLWPATPLPDYPQPVAVGAEPDPEPVRLPRRAPARLRLAAAGVGIGALGLAGGNLIVRRQALHGPEATAAEARAAQPLINGLALGSWTLGATSAGLFTTSLVMK